ncbi:TNT domain-containing protein [Fibrella arboris]|uniref:TNT domain-containing protein n=1 Tax=Fibrella arboris TaxID=3242486 RepID=UPI0035223802
MADKAYSLWRKNKWPELEELFNKGVDGKKINGGWPPNNGAIEETSHVLKKGDTFDRYGGWIDEGGKFRDKGKFGSPQDVPYSDRALLPGTDKNPKAVYEVMTDELPTSKGEVIPWFDESEKGTQYRFDKSIEDMLKEGKIRRVSLDIPPK